MNLGVNIDHIATLRESRQISEPNPLYALPYLQAAGANQVTIHLREDRRHICEDDVCAILAQSSLPVNIESSLNAEILEFLCAQRPHSITLVPERREEITTEGGLELQANEQRIASAIEKIAKAGIVPALFVDPTRENMQKSYELGARKVELHTGHYANVWLMLHGNLSRTRHSIEALQKSREELRSELDTSVWNLHDVAVFAQNLGLHVAAGHGLNAQNVGEVAKIGAIAELNIGHSIIGRAVFVGLKEAIGEILDAINKARGAS